MNGWRRRLIEPDSKHTLAWCLGLFAAAVAVRLPFLWQVPGVIDELGEVKVAYLIATGQSFPLHNNATDIGAMHNYILALLFQLFGINLYIPRFYVMITSAITVILVYYLGRRLFSHRAGIIAALLALTNGMNILVTHMAWANCTTPFFFMLAVLATLRAESQKSGKWLAGAAFLWALTLQTNSSCVVFVAAAAIYVLRPAFRRKTGIALGWYGWAFLAMAAGYANMIVYNIISGGGSLAQLSKKGYAMETKPGLESFLANLKALLVELFRSLGSVYTDYQASDTWRYFLDPFYTGAILLVGLGIYLAVRRRASPLPLYIAALVILVFPWINKNYFFFHSTRYILPLVLFGLVYMGGALEYLYERLNAALGETLGLKRLQWAAAAVLGLAVAAQLIPHYNYCASLIGTEQSNDYLWRAMADLDELAAGLDCEVVVDHALISDFSPVPNPLYDWVLIKGYRVRTLEAPSWTSQLLDQGFWEKDLESKSYLADYIAASKSPHLIVIMSGFTYRAFESRFPPCEYRVESARTTQKTRIGPVLDIYVVRFDK